MRRSMRGTQLYLVTGCWNTTSCRNYRLDLLLSWPRGAHRTVSTSHPRAPTTGERPLTDNCKERLPVTGDYLQSPLTLHRQHYLEASPWNRILAWYIRSTHYKDWKWTRCRLNDDYIMTIISHVCRLKQ